MTIQNGDEASHAINLTAAEHSKIAHVSLYASRAEVTRIFTFEAPAGQNDVLILGIPAIEANSLR